MLKLAYASHKLRVKHATHRTIRLEDSVAATRRDYNLLWRIALTSAGEMPALQPYDTTNFFTIHFNCAGQLGR